MSYIEFIGTVLYLWSVWLISKRRILTWPIGIISVLLYMILFYQIRLYSDTIEQLYYIGASIYGWYTWNKSPKDKGQITDVKFSKQREVILWISLTLVISIFTGFFMSRVHTLLPIIFPEKASFPYIDAITTIMSFSAMWLMAQKKIESWIYWILVDMIGIWLYFVKNVKFISLLYVILLIMAINGLLMWRNAISNRVNE
ncbi:MAG: nicotinamide mononucleotide transporter [Desulfobacterales bacterium]|nr:nicotinamide mononucleotide transporter [Desulfobacterales bacterium]MBF0396862.1 nicotinamide mononucleotide transporter [Desulfobacterales bacterium]